MGLTKTTAFSSRHNEIADIAKAFAHPARVAILEYLLKHKTCICGDLVDVLPLSQSTVSQHLKELKRIGIVKGNVEPPKVCYCINEAMWEKAKGIMKALFNSFEAGCC